jgi:hypothetical protein
MDEDVAAIDEKARRTRVALGWVAATAGLYLVLFIAVMSQLRTPSPSWSSYLFWPIPLFAIALWVLRYRHTWLKADAAMAQVRATQRSLDDLERELEANRD